MNLVVSVNDLTLFENGQHSILSKDRRFQTIEELLVSQKLIEIDPTDSDIVSFAKFLQVAHRHNRRVAQAYQIVGLWLRANEAEPSKPWVLYNFDGIAHASAEALLEYAWNVINETYAGEVEIVGQLAGSDREHWDVISTPYGKFTQGNWARQSAGLLDVGTVRIIKEGVAIFDMVIKDNTTRGIVVEASHEHNGLGDGTARIKVLYTNGSTELTTPWNLRVAS